MKFYPTKKGGGKSLTHAEAGAHKVVSSYHVKPTYPGTSHETLIH